MTILHGTAGWFSTTDFISVCRDQSVNLVRLMAMLFSAVFLKADNIKNAVLVCQVGA